MTAIEKRETLKKLFYLADEKKQYDYYISLFTDPSPDVYYRYIYSTDFMRNALGSQYKFHMHNMVDSDDPLEYLNIILKLFSV